MRKMLMAAAVAATMTAAPAVAQVAGGLVTVLVPIEIVKNSLNNNDIRFLNNNNIDIDALNNVTVQVPIGIAANVCGQAAVNLLSAVGGTATDVDCEATNSSKALSKSIVRALTTQSQ